jgi:hypothetical protein
MYCIHHALIRAPRKAKTQPPEQAVTFTDRRCSRNPRSRLGTGSSHRSRSSTLSTWPSSLAALYLAGLMASSSVLGKRPLLTEADTTRLTTTLPLLLTPESPLAAGAIPIPPGIQIHYRAFYPAGLTPSNGADVVEKARRSLHSAQPVQPTVLEGLLHTVRVSESGAVLWAFVLVEGSDASLLSRLDQLSFEGLAGLSLSFISQGDSG